MTKSVAYLVALLLPTVAIAQNTTAFRLGPGGQMTCSSTAPSRVASRGTIWCNSADNNKLYYTSPSGASSPLGEGATVSGSSYGVKCDGTTDDSVALQAAINAAKANGGVNNRGATVLLPKGQCKFGTPLDLKSSYGVRIVGQGGVAPGSPKPSTVLLYTGTGSTSAIQANASIGTQFLDVGILYNSASFTGILVDFSQGALGTGGAYALIQRCTIGGNTNDTLNAFGASSLISLDNMIDSQVKDSILHNAVEGIHLRDSNTHFANGIVISGNVFSDFSTAAITNGATNDVVTGNVFENNPGMATWNATHPGAFPTMAPALAYTSAMAQYGLVFTGNYIGDGDNSTYVFDTTNGTQYGTTFEGNYVFGNLKLGPTYGGSISKNTFSNVRIDFIAATTYTGLLIANNGLPSTSTLTFTNFPATGVSLLGNRAFTGGNNVADSFSVDKLVTESGNMTLAPAGTAIAPATDSAKDLGTSSLRFQNGFIKVVSAGAAGLTLTGGNTSYVANASGLDIGTAAAFPLCSFNATECRLGKTTIKTTIVGGLAVNTLATKTANYTVTIGDSRVPVSTAGGTFTVTLPAPATVGNGWQVEIADVGFSATTLTVARSAAEKINNVAGSYTMAMGGANKVFWTNGTDWFLR